MHLLYFLTSIIQRENLVFFTHLALVERENTDISSVVNVVATHDRVGVILNPNSCESVATNLVVLILAL